MSIVSYLSNNPLISPLITAWKSRELILSMAKREVLGRYRGSWFGLFWSLITPILLLLVYMFVFGVVFKARWPQAEGIDEGFASLLFCGIIIYSIFSELLTRSPRLIVDNANYVKKVVFPVEILGWIALLNSLFHFFLSLVVLVTFVAIFGAGISWHLILVPGLTLIFIVHLIGMTWLVSALGVYIRDISYVAGFLSTALIFLSPVFFPKAAVPENFALAMDYNPLTFYIESFRQVIVLSQVPDLRSVLIAIAISIFSFVTGYWFFQKTRKGFADVV